MKILLVLGLLVLSAGSSCLDNNTVLPGQLGQITDAVSVPCTPYPKDPKNHQCLLLANPYQGLARVFDMTNNQYVLSPIGYLPLAVRMGIFPQRLSSAAGRVFALDSASRAIYEIPGSFVSPLKTVFKTLNYAPDQFVVVSDKLAFVLDSEGKLHQEPLPTGDSVIVQNVSGISQMGLDLTGKYLWVLSGGLLKRSMLPNGDFKPVGTAGINVVAMDGEKLWTANAKELFFEDLSTKLGVSAALEAPGVAIYLPQSVPGTPAICCGKEKSWVAVLMANGKLRYYPFEKNQFGEPQTIDIAGITGVSSYAFTNPVKLIGAELEGFGDDAFGCARRLYIVYSGGLFGSCEGMGNIKRIDQMDF